MVSVPGTDRVKETVFEMGTYSEKPKLLSMTAMVALMVTER